MKTYFDCYPCFLRQALSAARRAGADDQQEYAVMRGVLNTLLDIQPQDTPPQIAYRVHRIVRDTVAADDPYKDAKSKSTADALILYPKLKGLVAQSDDPLDMAIRISIAGNIIDFAFSDHDNDLWRTVEKTIRQPYAIDDTQNLRKKLREASHILFLADNAGETVFDRVLIEVIKKSVVYAVKGGPILNDATMEDAVSAGLRGCAALISKGSDAPGTILPLCSDSFRLCYDEATLVIAKGQANYETLSDAGAKVFCLLQVKCPVIARDIGAPVGSIVVRQSIG